MAAVMRLALLAALLGIAASACAGEAEEGAIHAALVYKLLLFVEWPAAAPPADGALLLCVVAAEPETGRAFAALVGRTVKGRALAVERRAPLSHLDGCHAVYFDPLEPGLLEDKLARLAGRPVPTFAAGAEGTAPVMVRLALADGRPAFDVDQGALRAAGLALDARVLNLAREVRR